MAPIPPTNDPTYEVAVNLLGCLTTKVEALALPPKNVMFMPGSAVVEDLSIYTDLCCEGTAYVRHASTYPSGDSWPSPDTGQNNCQPIAWGTIFEIGIMRCAPTGSAQFGVTAAEWNAANTQYFIDMQALRATVCCYKTLFASGASDAGVLIGQITPLGVQGGCLVATMSVQIQTIGCGSC